MQESGKRAMKVASAVHQPSNNQSPRLFIRETGTKLEFLIDSGSDVSVLPKWFVHVIELEIRYTLHAANGTPIQTYGIHRMHLNLGLSKTYLWNFIVADVDIAIIGADLLQAHHLLPDLSRKRLVEGDTLCSTPCSVRGIHQLNVHLISTHPDMHPRVAELFKSFPALLRPPQYLQNPDHEIYHYIETIGPPSYEKSRRLSVLVEKEVRNEFSKMTQAGICRPSSSQWASPLVVVHKDNKMRIVGDYRRLNAKTKADRYPLPHLFDSTNNLNNKTVFSCVDLVRAFHNIPVFPKHVCKTAVISPIGLYEYLRMPFGLKNAPATFQRFMNSIVGDLPFIFCYLDDILVYSTNPEEHANHLQILFQRLEKYGLSLNINKSKFFVQEVDDFLGHKITPSGFQPTTHRIEFFKTMKKPRTIAALRRVLGLWNFYRRFTQKAADLLAPLNDILKGHTRKNDNTLIQWSDNLSIVFEQAKKAFSEYTLLHFPQHNSKLLLTCDASSVACGAVLEQMVSEDGKTERQPLGFYSAKFSSSQLNWATYDKELYAIYSAVEHFHNLIDGHELLILTDHHPLIHMFTTKKRIKLERRSRWIEFISQYSTDIQHISGKLNIVADALSRPVTCAIQAEVTPEIIAEAQQKDEETKQLRSNGYREQVLRDVYFNNSNNQSIFCSVFKEINRPVIPKVLRFKLFQQIHNLAHPGVKSTTQLLSSKFFWPDMKKDIRNWCRTCGKCQRVKITKHTHAPLQSFPDSDRFEHVHIDIVVLEYSEGYRYLCTFADRTTRWLEAIPLKDISAETVCKTFYEQWVSRYGVPLRITSDRGAQFTSQLFNELCSLLGSSHITTTAYNPKANGLLERCHRRLKEALKAHGKNWVRNLPTVLLGLRASPRDQSGISCAELTFGRTLKLPGEFYQQSRGVSDSTTFVRQLRDSLGKIRPVPFLHKSKRNMFVHKDLHDCKKVFVRIDRVRQPLEAPYDGPFTVIKRFPKYFLLDMGAKTDEVSIDRLKPAYELSEEDTSKSEEDKMTVKPILKSGTSQDTTFKNTSCKSNDKSFFVVLPETADISPSSNLVLPETPSVSSSTIPDTAVNIAGGSRTQRVHFNLPKVTSRGRTVKPPERYR